MHLVVSDLTAGWKYDIEKCVRDTVFQALLVYVNGVVRLIFCDHYDILVMVYYPHMAIGKV